MGREDEKMNKKFNMKVFDMFVLLAVGGVSSSAESVATEDFSLISVSNLAKSESSRLMCLSTFSDQTACM